VTNSLLSQVAHRTFRAKDAFILLFLLHLL
jgi:hypothetical protein